LFSRSRRTWPPAAASLALVAAALTLAASGRTLGAVSVVNGPEQAEPGLVLAGQLGGRVTAVTIAGSHAYLGQGARLVVAGWQPPAPPLPLGQTSAGVERIADIAVQDGKAYVAAGLSGLWVADVADPTRPRWLGGTTLDNVEGPVNFEQHPEAVRVVVSGHLAAVTTADHLQFVDVSEPARPLVVGQHRPHRDFFDSPRGVAFVGDLAYVAQTEDGLVVLDLSEPARPREVARLTTIRPRAIVADGDRAYLALDEPAGLMVLDLHVPTDPRPLAQLSLARPPADIWIAGGRAYLLHMDAANGLGQSLSPSGAVTVVDITEPEHPAALGMQPLGDPASYTAYDFQAAFALIAGAGGRLTVVDLANLSGPRLLGAYAPGWYHSSRMKARDGRLFALDYYGQLQALDLSLPDAPRPSRTFAPGFHACGLAIGDGQLYLGRRGGGLAVVDIASPGGFRVTGSLDASWSACRLATEGPLVAVAAGEGGLRVVDASDPTAPVERTTAGSSGPAWEVALAGAHAYLATGCCVDPPQAGVRIVDLRDPAAPRVAGLMAEDLFAWALVTERNRLLIWGRSTTKGEDRLEVYDVSLPAQPQRIFRRSFPPDELHNFSHIDLHWPLAAGLSYEGVVVFDITQPDGVERVLQKGHWPNLHGLALTADHVYAGHAWEQGYTVGRLSEAGATATQLTGYSVGYPGISRVVASDAAAYAVTHSSWAAGGRDLLEVIDLRDPAQPRQIQRLADWEMLHDLALAGSQLLLLSELGGQHRLEGMSITQSGELRTGWMLELNDRAERLTVDRSVAWVIGKTEANRPVAIAVDLADTGPATVIARRELVGVKGVTSAMVVDGRLFALTDTGFRVWDVRDPSALLPEGSLPLSVSWTEGLVVEGDWAFAASRLPPQLLVIDVRDGTTPVVAARLDLDSDLGVLAMAKGQLFLSDGIEQNLTVVDVAQPTRPALLRTDHLWPVQDLAVVGDRAWLAAGAVGLQGLDLKGIERPLPARSAPRSWTTVSGLARQGDLVAVAAGADGLRLVSLALANQPMELGAASDVTPALAVALALVGTVASVAVGAEGLVLLDLTTPARPRRLGSLAIDDATHVVARDGTVFVVGSLGLSILDAQDPARPATIAQLDGVSGQLALSADGRLGATAGGQVLDLSDPRNPRRLADLALSDGDRALAVALAGRRLFVARDGGTVVGFDLTDPTAPRELTLNELPGDAEQEYVEARSLATDGPWLFVLDTRGSIGAYDLTRPNDVRLVARFQRGSSLEPYSDAWRSQPEMPVTALLAAPDAVLAGQADDGLWWLRRAGPLVPRWRTFLPLTWAVFGESIRRSR
jgi:hypothetical protein